MKLDAPQFDSNNPESSPNARRARWEQLLNENKGKIDVTLAQQMLGDHVDAFEKKTDANERTLCGHVDNNARGISIWGWGPYYPGGAVQGKGNRLRHDQRNASRSPHGTSVRRKFPGQTIPGRSSRIRLAGALPARHERRPVVLLPIGRSPTRSREINNAIFLIRLLISWLQDFSPAR